MLLLFLSFVAARYLVDHVYVDAHGGYTAATLGVWMVLRFGLLLSLQPFLYGLILLSRREWAIGGASLGVSLITLVLVSLLTFTRFPPARRKDFTPGSRKALDDMGQAMSRIPSETSLDGRPQRLSDSSMLQRLATLLPGYARLPPECPLPLASEGIDDLFFTENASSTQSRPRQGRIL